MSLFPIPTTPGGPGGPFPGGPGGPFPGGPGGPFPGGPGGPFPGGPGGGPFPGGPGGPFPGGPGGGPFPGGPGGGSFPGGPGGSFPGGPGGPFPGGPGGPGGAPTAPPPSFVPQMPIGTGAGVGALAVDPGAIRRCMFRNTYVWLNNGEQFWFFPVFVGRTSVAGFRWFGRFWAYFGIDLNRIRSFTCF